MIIEYPISINYLQHWTIYDAIREFIQNAIDVDETFTKDNIKYYGETKELYIINKGELSKNSLLLGNTSKDGKSTIGQFGEGYKVGALVLSRNNKGVDILSLNNFTFYIADSLQFQEPVLNVAIKNNFKFFENTIVKIQNVYKDELNKIIENTLILKNYTNCNHSCILYDKSEKGRIYVGGLYVCDVPNLYYGYNFKPGILELNRDRNLANTWDVYYHCAELINNLCEQQLNNNIDSLSKEIYNMIKENTGEAEHLSNYHISNSVATAIHKEFIKEEGNKYVASNQSELNNLNYKIISDRETKIFIGSSTLINIIKKSNDYKEPTIQHKYRKNAKPIDILNQYASEHEVNEKDWNEIECLAKTWRIKNSKIIYNFNK